MNETNKIESNIENLLPIKHSELLLDGESWKNKENITYSSILDLYGVSDLFTEQTNRVYKDEQDKEQVIQQKLQEYVFSDWTTNEQTEVELINYIFSDDVNLSKMKSYKSENGNDRLSAISIGIVLVIVFGIIMSGYNRERKKRREKFATEINMENIGAK